MTCSRRELGLGHVDGGGAHLLDLLNLPSLEIRACLPPRPGIGPPTSTADEAGYVEKMRTVARTITDEASANWLFLFPLLAVTDADISGLPVNATSLALDLSRVRRG